MMHATDWIQRLRHRGQKQGLKQEAGSFGRFLKNQGPTGIVLDWDFQTFNDALHSRDGALIRYRSCDDASPVTILHLCKLNQSVALKKQKRQMEIHQLHRNNWRSVFRQRHLSQEALKKGFQRWKNTTMTTNQCQMGSYSQSCTSSSESVQDILVR